MSAPVAGKFQDHYAVLGVAPNADTKAIEEAYRKLQAEELDPEKTEAIGLAFEVLSDPVLRASFDKAKGGGAEKKPQFSGISFFEGLKRASDVRAAILCILYDRRWMNPFLPSISVRHLEGMLRVTNDELNFALWYLKQRSLVVNDDKSSLQIAADGMDWLEQNPPAPERVMPLLKADAISQKRPESAAKTSPASGTILNALNRAITGKERAVVPAARR